jgi:hypothetical protein
MFSFWLRGHDHSPVSLEDFKNIINQNNLLPQQGLPIWAGRTIIRMCTDYVKVKFQKFERLDYHK